MKKLLALLIVPVATLTGCVSSSNPNSIDAHHCHQIVRQMHEATGQYKPTGGNKHLTTTEAKLQKDYKRYRCDQFDRD
ncbi:MAG: hypothetical protein KDH94_04325 [Coxiellaceae bacterium]|nr:hypothetical protein [Coxiellaceae bacterium]